MSPLIVKGFLASAFTAMSMYVIADMWPEVDTDSGVEGPFKTMMFILAVLLITPQLRHPPGSASQIRGLPQPPWAPEGGESPRLKDDH